jgi:hypothetical protein
MENMPALPFPYHLLLSLMKLVFPTSFSPAVQINATQALHPSKPERGFTK